MTLLALRTGRLAVDLAPAAGGSVARFTVDEVDILRPMTEAAVASGQGDAAGLHPFFVRDPDCVLTCRTQAVWRADAEVLPVERIPVPPEWDFGCGRHPDSVMLDNCFDGWDGRATIAWPQRRRRLELEASAPFRHAVIYSPPGQRYFCVEPVSHAHGRVGLAALGPRSTLAGVAGFRLSDM